ncbi:MAG: 3-deoxy-manno-octulosonate cytidylyltransferase [Proteobacteria bacterium]|nr:3-deoxy-manno-octulosonate cytidylyltransferase [Pseudomonadota bacterium]
MIKAIVIPARYASTRLPGKALREIGGKPIIRWVYEKAMESKLKDEVIIATDDERIRDRALAFGAVVAMTSPDCRSGTDRCMEALQGRNADIIVNLQGDEPFIRPDMVDMLFDAMVKEHLDMATLCCPIEDAAEYGNPNIVKVVLDRFGFALYFSRSPIPYLRNAADCGLPIADCKFQTQNSYGSIPTEEGQLKTQNCIYKHIGIYAFSRSFLEKYVAMEKGILEGAESLEQLRVLENGYKIKVLLTDYNGFGIDTEEDLEQAKNIVIYQQ